MTTLPNGSRVSANGKRGTVLSSRVEDGSGNSGGKIVLYVVEFVDRWIGRNFKGDVYIPFPKPFKKEISYYHIRPIL